MDITDAFDRRLEHVPADWVPPLVEVVDTAEAVRIALKRWGMENDAAAVVGLTRLVLERHAYRHRIATGEGGGF
jgi:hypothetical protein